jgi:hypothetical protein
MLMPMRLYLKNDFEPSKKYRLYEKRQGVSLVNSLLRRDKYG